VTSIYAAVNDAVKLDTERDRVTISLLETVGTVSNKETVTSVTGGAEGCKWPAVGPCEISFYCFITNTEIHEKIAYGNNSGSLKPGRKPGFSMFRYSPLF
jgi:hypothetical protein